jgi:hypothetical protein
MIKGVTSYCKGIKKNVITTGRVKIDYQSSGFQGTLDEAYHNFILTFTKKLEVLH